ncbi:BRCT domain-containing protein [Acinetobacter modestus]|uniref:BRCT domain-containing protein n=1 Tax=Acinetobacter modestus TaxID=1776740 RepID=UPI001F4B8E56|nr:BRCT domain-containing protein [Acinetobacter modestus]MCH7329632.1 BRCT domain-containing protein [Acinetobacter modestus]
MSEQKNIEKFMGNAISDKSINTFLGFLEGVTIDGKINEREIDAILEWYKNMPELNSSQFEMLFKVLSEITTVDGIGDEEKERFIKVLNLFNSTEFYKKNTADVQRLHGLLAGLVCDSNLILEELVCLNTWLKDHDHLEEDILYQEIFNALRPLRTKKTLTTAEINSIFKLIARYVDPDHHGQLKKCVDSNDNPDFYKGKITLEDAVYCFTGASTRFKKSEWKALVENNGAKFVDDMTLKVNYLVICNKGNSAWAHVSYGRKFEQAKKWQNEGNAIKIITEDDFVALVNLAENN